jgi:hypothetical protein
MANDHARIERGVVVWSNARALVGMFRPQTWVVLHDLVFDAEWIDDRWVAPSSARLIADHLRIAPGTSAAALRQLRDSGVAELIQASGSVGRFGLAAYALQLPPGVEIISPCVGRPHTVAAHGGAGRGRCERGKHGGVAASLAGSPGGIDREGVSGSPRPRDGGPVSGGEFACPKGWQVSVELFVAGGGAGC